MRHFVYLDTDTLNSYLSQINGGLLKSAVNEVKDEVATTQNENTIPGKSNFTGEFGLKPLFGLKFSEDKETVNTTNTLSQIETGRELIEKILHDNAFDLFGAYLKENNLLDYIDNCMLGNYVEINNDFTIRDLGYLTNIFTEDFIDFISNMGIESLKSQIDNAEMSSSVRKSKERELVNIKKKSEEEFIGYKKILNIIGDMLPYSQFIICEECLIPITNKYLRESLSQIRFNYSGKIKVLGKFTSVFKDSINKEKENETFLGGLNSTLDQTFKELYVNMLGFNENMKIVIPIALYFE